MYTIKQTKQKSVCDYIVTNVSFGTVSKILLEKHVREGALLVKEISEKDAPVFAETAPILSHLIEMQSLGASRKQCVLLIVGESEFAAELSLQWQLLGGVCVNLPEEKRKGKVLSDLASLRQGSMEDLLIGIPYVSYDVVKKNEEDNRAFPFFMELISSTESDESLEYLGVHNPNGAKIREIMGIPDNMTMWTYRGDNE